MNLFPRRRILPKLSENEHSYVHCLSRVVDRRLIFGEEEKQKFLFYLRRYERFCRLRVVGYVLMDNHFHLVVCWRGRPQTRPSQSELIKHVRETLGNLAADKYQERVDFWEEQLAIGARRKSEEGTVIVASPLDVVLGSEVDLEGYAADQLEKVSRDIWQRMFDVSKFILSVKQQFSSWYNKKNGRLGTLWEERFRTTLVQPGPALGEILAYMDLNPVRVGIVSDPKDYPWSQYGAARSGDEAAIEGMLHVSEILFADIQVSATQRGADFAGSGVSNKLDLALAIWTVLLERRGEGDGREGCQITAEQARLARVLLGPDVVPGKSYISGEVKGFSRGGAVGDPAFLDALFQSYRSQFGLRRRSAARVMRQAVSVGEMGSLPNGVSHQYGDQAFRVPRGAGGVMVLRDVRP